MTKRSKHAELCKTVRDRYSRGVSADRQNREDMRDDLDFLAGNQWPTETASARRANKRIMVTENRLPAFVNQVTGEMRQSLPAIRVRGVDDKSDTQVAEILSGLIRDIESRSSTGQPYITAGTHAAQCGIGWFRIITDYAEEDSFDQEVRMEPIRNMFSVVCDPDAVKATKQDANWIIVVAEMEREAFKAKYPKAKVDGFDEDEPLSEYDQGWYTDEKIRIAEYWVKEPYTYTIGRLPDGEIERVPDGYDTKANPRGYEEYRERESHKVYCYKVSGAEVLEDRKEWLTPDIPIIAVIGEEIQLENGVQRRGVIRFAKDPQMLLNFWSTTQAEWLALQPKAPYLATANQVEGVEAQWKNANDTTAATLIYNPDPEAPGPPQRSQPPVGSAALQGEVMRSVDTLKAVTGIYDASLGAQSNETSGRAIRERKQQSTTGTYTFIDNLARSIEHAGRILIDLIPQIYDNERVVRILGEDDQETYETINRVLAKDGEDYTENDLSVGRYDTVVTVGPSYATKRAEAAESMMQFVQTVPSGAQAIADLIAKNMDWPGAEAISDRLKKMLPPELQEIDDDDEEGQQRLMAQQQAAQQQAAITHLRMQLDMAEMQNKVAKLEAETLKIKAETQKTMAETVETRVDTKAKMAEAMTTLQQPVAAPQPLLQP